MMQEDMPVKQEEMLNESNTITDNLMYMDDLGDLEGGSYRRNGKLRRGGAGKGGMMMKKRMMTIRMMRRRCRRTIRMEKRERQERQILQIGQECMRKNGHRHRVRLL